MRIDQDLSLLICDEYFDKMLPGIEVFDDGNFKYLRK